MWIKENPHLDIFLKLDREAISWKTMKQSILVASTMGQSLWHALRPKLALIGCRTSFQQLDWSTVFKPVKIYCDNSATVFFLKMISILRVTNI